MFHRSQMLDYSSWSILTFYPHIDQRVFVYLEYVLLLQLLGTEQ